MTLLSHTLWGALFCIPHGFSFTALRFSTLLLSLTGALAMYGLIRQLQRPRLLAVVCALTLVFNPIYFALSNTFMTDVPFTALAILSALFFVRHLQRGSDADLLVGTIFAVIATLSRQMALCLPFAFGVTLWLKHGFQGRSIIRAIFPLIVCMVILAAFLLWQKITGRPPTSNVRTDLLWAFITHPKQIRMAMIFVSWSSWGMLLYLGLFLSPLILPASLHQRPEPNSPFCLPASVALFVFFIASAVRLFLAPSLIAPPFRSFLAHSLMPSLMPGGDSIIIPQGIGPATLRDIYILHLPHLPALPSVFWLLVTVLSLVGAAILVFKTTRSIVELFPKGRFDRANTNGPAAIFFLLCAVVYLAPFLLSGVFFDRYLIPVTAFLAAFLAASPEGRGFKMGGAQKLAATLLIVIGPDSVKASAARVVMIDGVLAPVVEVLIGSRSMLNVSLPVRPRNTRLGPAGVLAGKSGVCPFTMTAWNVGNAARWQISDSLENGADMVRRRSAAASGEIHPAV